MSTTTSNAPMINPDGAIQSIATASTPRDIARAAAADPDLNAALFQLLTAPNTKGLLQSKTFWAAILTPIVSEGVLYFGLKIDPATVHLITMLLEGIAMVAMRVITKTPVAGLVGPSVSGPVTP